MTTSPVYEYRELLAFHSRDGLLRDTTFTVWTVGEDRHQTGQVVTSDSVGILPYMGRLSFPVIELVDAAGRSIVVLGEGARGEYHHGQCDLCDVEGPAMSGYQADALALHRAAHDTGRAITAEVVGWVERFLTAVQPWQRRYLEARFTHRDTPRRRR